MPTEYCGIFVVTITKLSCFKKFKIYADHKTGTAPVTGFYVKK